MGTFPVASPIAFWYPGATFNLWRVACAGRIFLDCWPFLCSSSGHKLARATPRQATPPRETPGAQPAMPRRIPMRATLGMRAPRDIQAMLGTRVTRGTRAPRDRRDTRARLVAVGTRAAADKPAAAGRPARAEAAEPLARQVSAAASACLTDKRARPPTNAALSSAKRGSAAQASA